MAKHAKIQMAIFVGLMTAATAQAGGSAQKRGLDSKDSDVPSNDGVEMVSHQLLVKFDSENAALERHRIFKNFGGREIERVGTTPLFLVQFADGTDILDIKVKLEHIEGVSYAEPNIVMRTMPVKSKIR